MKNKIIIILGALFLMCHLGMGQDLLINQGHRSENGLWCFPLLSDTTQYLYLPADAALVMEDSLPKFSFMRYILEKPSTEASSSALSQADGGGILHFLVQYYTPKGMIQQAEEELRETYENEDIRIRGPVVFKKARYTVISSIVNEDNVRTNRYLTSGEAPVLEGSKIALAFEMDPIKSKLLMESLKMTTSDISVAFELTFEGISDHFEASMEVDWNEVKNSQSFGGKANVYVVSAEVEAGFEKLRKNNNIRLDIRGSNTKMEALIQVVYDKLLTLMFEPVIKDDVPKEDNSNSEDFITDAVTGLFETDGALGSGNILGFGLSAHYKQKDINFQGTGTMDFTGRFPSERNHFLTFNLGNLYQEYGQDSLIFRDVPMWDPAFQQRAVYVGIDGSLEREFEDMIEGVTVWIKKQHANDDITLKDVFVNKDKFSESEGRIPIIYLNHGDTDLDQWMNYEYKTIWNFTGGAKFTTAYKPDASSMINLYTPFKRKAIELEGDLDELTQADIKVTKVKIEYDFFGETQSHDVKIRQGDALDEKSFEITLPNDQDEINYTITWFKKDGSRMEKQGTDQYGLIFIDDLPE